MANTVYMSKTGLIGGEATKLDSIDGAGLVDNDAAFVNVSNVQYIYRLDADSAAVESSPDIIAPDTNPGDKRWILQSTLSPAPDIGAATGTSLTLSGLTASLPVFSDGSKKLVSKSVADTLTALGVGSSSFLAYVASDVANYTGDGASAYLSSAYGVNWTEVYDNGSVFSNGTFTAPATGFYILGIDVHFYNIGSSHITCSCFIDVNGVNYYLFSGNPYACSSSGNYVISGSIMVYMTSGDTAVVFASIGVGTKVVYLTGSTVSDTKFYGYRLK